MSASKELTKINSLNPNVAKRGGVDFILTITGKNFTRNSVVRWNGASRQTIFISSEALTAKIKAADIETAGDAIVTVAASASPGASLTNALTFTIVQQLVSGKQPPISKSMTPSSVEAGGEGFELIVTGLNFEQHSVIRYNGNDRQTSRIDATSLKAFITGSEIRRSELKCVTVSNPSTEFTSP